MVGGSAWKPVVVARSHAPRKAEEEADSDQLDSYSASVAKNKTKLFNGRLARRQIDSIVAAAVRGEIQLPELDLPSDEHCMTVGSLADAGSAAHVADKAKHFPGAEVRPSKGQARGVKYVVANGGELDNKGELDVQWRATDNRLRTTTFQNAEVGMPRCSISCVAKDKHRAVFEDNGGYILHKPTGHKFEFIIASGVYFIKMLVPRRLVDPGFGRHGSA